MPKYALLLAFLALPANPQAPPQPQNVWLASFDQVWQTIKDRHWDPERKGASWDAARAELRPLIEKGASGDEARAILNQLLARLGQSHFGIIPASTYAALQSGKTPGDAEPGFDVRIVDGLPLVTRVLPGSPAARAGIRPGWALLRIGNDEIAPRLEKLKDRPMLQTLALSFRLQGEPGDSLDLLFDTAAPGAEPRSVQLTLASPPGRPVQFGNLPPLRMNIERAEPRPGIVHLRWNSFFEPQWLQDELRAVIDACAPDKCRGVILDVRGNGGGLAILAPSVSAWFLDKQVHIGTMFAPTGPLKLVAYPRPTSYPGKLALLIDGLSASTSEFLAAGLKDLDRARLFGEKTPGMALPSLIELLPSGDRFQFATADYVSLGGDPVEGRGVTPHVAVPLTRTALLEGRDPALEAALAWILN